ncbi:hypothetical protein ES288_1Z010200v1 [Gossypium darwinii]|uniref:Peptide N-acetyl-beta-D-glucosaminyl asparaginase amidase A N-terminal domain-containing protein n=1 Tax=Gossypium darwinii TaxID=34276 RepID=A0A5C7J2C3_GOSDA|nr:hypothetical protein ES288_1Z010200v1 [Gossypium darwinii]
MANLHKTKNMILRSNHRSHLINTIPFNENSSTVYFEVTKPIKLPNTKPCSYHTPVVVNYTRPACYSQKFTKIVLEWKATCKGTQFDRIFGVWLSGVELLRGCTAEPTPKGIIWSVEKDITRYNSLLLKNQTQTLAVYLGNIVDQTYTGVYHVNLTFHFYPVECNVMINNDENKISLNNLASNYYSKADLILPISQDRSLNDGLWFEVRNSNETKSKQFQIPENVYRAVLEVHISFHENDEFWYGNFQNDYIAANNLSDTPGNGPFREVVIYLDGEVVGAVWPFTVIYTGGINPSFWTPITGISSFNLPSYDIEITPFLGNMLDGKPHTLGFSVTNALNVWFIDANLHLWLDTRKAKTEGGLVKFSNKAANVYEESDFKGLNGTFLTYSKRLISSTGWIKSCYGNITTHSIQEFRYNNSLQVAKDGDFQVVDQMIHFNDRVYTKMPFHHVHVEESFKTFHLNFYADFTVQGEGSFIFVSNVTLGFNENKYKHGGLDFFISFLRNTQKAQSVIEVKNYSTTKRLRGTKQVYEYHGSDICYSRNISSSNNLIEYDEGGKLCDDFEVKPQTISCISKHLGWNQQVTEKETIHGFFLLNPLLYLLPLLFLDPLFSQANLHHSKTFKSSLLSQSSANETISPTLFFEVTKPINLPTTKPCSLTVLQHDFGFTYGKPPVLANYNFPSDCPFQEFSKIVLEWNATCKGRQFDRIFGVWLSGVELLRSCTAEPRPNGIFWSVKKDITRYSSLLLSNDTQTFAVYLGNIVDKTYTGVYHVNVTLYFYPAVQKPVLSKEKWGDFGSEVDSKADLIIPFSRDMPLNDGLWYEIENATDVKVKEFVIPQNVYRAVLEVYVSFHENDEFWYGNLPNEYIAANNLTDVAGNGPFREVVVSLDGEVIGAVWPFTVVYTGGINPLLFSVTNALNVWYIDANLHLWLDSKRAKTEGKLLQYDIVPLSVTSVVDFKGLNGTFVTNTTRFISSTGWVKSSYGIVTTKSIQDLSYSNSMVINGNLQIINQTVHLNDSVYADIPAPNDVSKKSLKRFLFYLYSDDIDQGNGTTFSVSNVTLGFDEKKFKDADAGKPSSSLRNLQKGKGIMVVKDNLVVSGVASTQQSYNYEDGNFCYSRNISSSNYTILYDEVRNTCDKRAKSHFRYGLSRWWPFPARRAFLASHVTDPNGNQ